MHVISVAENLLQVSRFVFGYRVQTSPPPVLEVQVSRYLVFSDFAVYLAITRLFFKRVLFDKCSFQVVVEIWLKVRTHFYTGKGLYLRDIDPQSSGCLDGYLRLL